MSRSFQDSDTIQKMLPDGRQVTSTGIAKRSTSIEATNSAELNRQRAEREALQKGYSSFSSINDAGCAVCAPKL